MKKQSDNASTEAPKKTLRFTPKIPPRKLPKPAVVKTEVSEKTDDIIDKELLAKLNNAKSQGGFTRRVFKTERKTGVAQEAFGYGDTSKIRSFGNPKIIMGKSEDGSAESALKPEKEYEAPWDYHHSYYPTLHPLRRPHSGDPEILNKQEFGEAASTTRPAFDEESWVKPAEELGLMEEGLQPQMLFFQLPANLPLLKRDDDSKKGCQLKDLPAGFMGKMLVYKSGVIKMKLGEALFDVNPGGKCLFAQDVVAINTREKHFCNLGELGKRAVVTADLNSLLSSMEDMDV